MAQAAVAFPSEDPRAALCRDRIARRRRPVAARERVAELVEGRAAGAERRDEAAIAFAASTITRVSSRAAARAPNAAS